MFKKRFLFIICLVAIFIISFSGSYIMYDYLFKPELKPKTIAILSNKVNSKKTIINSDTIINKEESYKCGNRIKENISNKPWLGKDTSILKKTYPPTEGWDIQGVGQRIIISKYHNKICPFHQKRHFGLYQNKLAIYEGPLGNNEKVIEVESNVDIANLPVEYLENLKEAMKITDINANISKDLRDELEFANESELEEALQNLDEYME